MEKIKDNILCWCKDLEQEALQQAINLSEHPWLVGNVCLMPDCHAGVGMPIGGVVALDNAISPNMIGVDIACGMLAVKTSMTEIDTPSLKTVLGGIRKRIPVGKNHHKQEQACEELFCSSDWENTTVCRQEIKSAKCQLGTLGGGNHFIEIQKGNDGCIWFMIHSGSRNLGFRVAKHYNDIAREICIKWKQEKIEKDRLAIIPADMEEAKNYIREHDICLSFAYHNRLHMANVIKELINEVKPNVDYIEEINIHHNYAALEHHYGRNVWVHRKGATLATEDTTGIIPGSQGTSSYIVKGKGNPTSLNSCSHGAGRKMSRTKARECLDIKSEQKFMDDKGILHGLRHKDGLDEAPSAYKDIDEVMKTQEDLVEILVKLEPLAVVKE